MITQIKRKITQIDKKDLFTHRIISCCYKVHSELGPGFNEKIYHNTLKLAFQQDGLQYETQKRFEVYYLSQKVGNLIVDLIVDSKVIVEVKAVAGYIPNVFIHQLLSYLRISKLKVGLLVNFGNKSCQVRRLVF